MIGSLPTAITAPDTAFLDGQVEVADGVALSPGVVLKAAPGCRLIVAPGVCLGHGVIVQACRGNLVIEPGAVLGSGVLVVGRGHIGSNACIGADSTLINPSVLARQVVPPNALLGDPSPRQSICETSTSHNDPQLPTPEQLPSSAVPHPAEPPQPQGSDAVVPSEPINPQRPESSNGETPASTDTANFTTADGLDDVKPEASSNGAGASPAPVHGQKQVQQLIATLFPHRQPLNGVSAKDKP